jgi:hypothetical protein
VSARGRGQRSGIDWEAAFGYYAALGPARSFSATGRKFGVTQEAVGQFARRHGWAERVAELDAKTRVELDERVVRSRAVRLAETIELVDLARTEVLERLRAGEAEVKLADRPALVKLELLLEGEATGRIEVAEVRTVVHAVIAIAGRFIPQDRRSEFALALADATAAIGPPDESDCEDEDVS